MTGHTIFEQSETQRHRLDVRTHARTHARTHTHTLRRQTEHREDWSGCTRSRQVHARTHARTHTHTHFGDKQSTEKTGLDVLDLVRCKAEQTR